jgi:hypothetical protein
MSTLLDITDTISTLDEQIDTLQDRRSDLTSRLEDLARIWHERYPLSRTTRSFEHRLSCTRCYFCYQGVKDGEVSFGTDCTYCGRNAGNGVTISVAWLNRALNDEEGRRT